MRSGEPQGLMLRSWAGLNRAVMRLGCQRMERLVSLRRMAKLRGRMARL